jgi:hypothetical protein
LQFAYIFGILPLPICLILACNEIKRQTSTPELSLAEQKNTTAKYIFVVCGAPFESLTLLKPEKAARQPRDLQIAIVIRTGFVFDLGDPSSSITN